MAEIYVPSVSSGGSIDSNKQIERVMEVERIPLTRMEEERDELRMEHDLWSSVKRNLSSLQESSRSMYQFNNPFSARIVESNNERVVIGRSINNSLLGTYSLSIKQKATADRFASDPIEADYNLEAGSYGFSVGTNMFEIPFAGGTPQQLAEAITINGKGKLSASLIQVSDAHSVFLIASRETGVKNPLTFHNTAQKFASEIGILGSPQAERLSFAQAFVSAVETPRFELNPGEQVSFFIKKDVHTFTIASTVAIEANVSAAQNKSHVQKGDAISIDRGTIDFSKLTIQNDSDRTSEVELSAFTESRPVPTNPISRAQNAIVVIEGIQVERPDNEIDEILPGLSLEVRSTSEIPVEVNVSPDTEFAKQEIIRLVGNYNMAMQRINVLTRDDPAIVDDIVFSSEEERANALDELGTLRGDTILTRLRSRLVNAASAAMRINSSISFLNEIGISTNQQTVGSANSSSLRGYLEINEETLDSALSESFEFVSHMFGSDANDDQIIDSGFAYAVSEAIRQYTQSGGIIDIRTQRISNQIKESDTQIERYSDKLEDREAELRRQFATMEQQVQALQENSRALNGFLGRE